MADTTQIEAARQPLPERIRTAIGAFAADIRRSLFLGVQVGRWWSYVLLQRLLGRPTSGTAAAVRLRRLIEASGVTPVKIGQYLAMRLDLLPAEVCQELSKLFAAVPPMPFAQVRAVIEDQFARRLEDLFPEFDTQPLGAASIAQVHRARDRAGRWLAVKVQRPGVVETLTTDFRILRRFAALADRFAVFGSISAVALVGETAAFTLRETDFRQEGRTADRIQRESRGDIHVPTIYWHISGPRVLSMELIDGVPLSEIIAAAAAGDAHAFRRVAPRTRPREIVDTLSRACLRQLFVTGLFQGDPHPANILIEHDGRVSFVDFGIFGELSHQDRRTLSLYVGNLALGRVEAAFECYASLVEPTADTDFAAFRAEVVRILADWHATAGRPEVPAKDKLVSRYQGLIFAAMRRHELRMRRDLLLFWRALAVLDATAQLLPVHFDLLATTRRFFAERQPSLGSYLATAIMTRPSLIALREQLADEHRAAARLGRLTPQRGVQVETTRLRARRHEAGRDTKTLVLAVFGIAVGVWLSGARPVDPGAAAVLAAAGLLVAAWRAVQPS